MYCTVICNTCGTGNEEERGSIFRNFWQKCSFQTSTGTLLMHLVEEKMGAAARDEDDELLLVL